MLLVFPDFMLQLTQEGRHQEEGNELTVKAVDTRGRAVRDPLLDDMRVITAGPAFLQNDQTTGIGKRKDEEARI